MSRLDPNNRKKPTNPSATHLQSLDLKDPPPDLKICAPENPPNRAYIEQHIAVEAIKSARGYCSAQTDVDREYQWRIMQEKLTCSSCGRKATDHFVHNFNCAFNEGSHWRRINTPPPYVWSYHKGYSGDRIKFALCPECMFDDFAFIGPNAAGDYRPVMGLEDNDYSKNWRWNQNVLTSSRVHSLVTNHEIKRATNPSLPPIDIDHVRSELWHRAYISYNGPPTQGEQQWVPCGEFRDNVPDYDTLAMAYIPTEQRKKAKKHKANPLDLPKKRLKLDPEEQGEGEKAKEKENEKNVNE